MFEVRIHGKGGQEIVGSKTRAPSRPLMTKLSVQTLLAAATLYPSASHSPKEWSSP